MADNDDTTISLSDLETYGRSTKKPGAKDRRRAARDMAPGEMTMLRKLMSKFLGEEANEPEHMTAVDALLSKAEVGYEHPAKGPNHCSQCQHFRNGLCELVAGIISPEDWCKKFEAKTAQDEAINAAGVVVRAADGRVLFMKRSAAGDHAGEWAFPGGKIEGRETPTMAARRELHEETGYSAPRLHSFSSDIRLKVAGDSKINFHTFLHHAKDCFNPALDEEHTEFMWAKPENAPQPLHPGVKAFLAHDKVKQKLAMDPLTAKGQEIMANMKRQYGEKKGERVFYASANKGRISGVDPAHDDQMGMITSPNAGVPGWLSNAKGQWGSFARKLDDVVLGREKRKRADAEDRANDCDCMAHDSIIAFDDKFQRTKDIDGRLHVGMTPISKAVVNPYLGKEIPRANELGLDPKKTYYLYRHPDELKKGAATFNNIPLLITHEPTAAKDHKPDLVIGSTGTDAAFKDPYLTNSLVVWAQSPINLIENGKQKELSASYHYDADMTPGVAPDGTHYDGVMRNIKGNHIALVKEGRAGHDVMVSDSAEGFKWGRIEAALDRPTGEWK